MKQYYIIEEFEYEPAIWETVTNYEETCKIVEDIRKSHEHGIITIIYGEEVDIE